jgi:hypothetical protein
VVDDAEGTANALALQLALELVAVQRQLIEQLHLPHPPPEPGSLADKPDYSQPREKDWRTWRGFCLAMQRLATDVKRQQHGRAHVSKVAVALRAGVSEKTISRTMRGYGLHGARDWPPFDWDPDADRVWHNPDERK